MKKLINDPRRVVEEMVDGLAAMYGGLRRVEGHTILIRADAERVRERQVALISGGGSGHEPAHAGYVGAGMLSAAVAGDVFTSPSPDAVYAAIRAVAGPLGALLIVKNYTGDRLNFGLAAEQARSEGIPVEMVLVADDVALPDQHAGRRGLAGTILVHKIAGMFASVGDSLADVAAAARDVAAAVRTMGVALTPCTVPAAGRPGFTLGDDEIELGLGIHGEPGVRRGAIERADALVEFLLDRILAEVAPGRVVLMVNNLGGTPPMELAIVGRRAVALLEERGYAVERVYCGTFLSALEMAGVSLTVLPVHDGLLHALDAPVGAPAWPNAAARPRARTPATVAAVSTSGARPAHAPATPLGQQLDRAIRACCRALVAAEASLTTLDQQVGDGDLGISLTRGAEAVLASLPTLPLDDAPAALHELALTLQRALGGTSGPLYGVLLLRLAQKLRAGEAWHAAFRAGVAAIAELGGAAPGERTMLDALVPAADALPHGLHAAARAAQTGAEATAQMLPRRGRSSYLGERAVGHPDPGAVAVAVWLEALAEVL